MATIKRGILGGGSGSVANVVMTAWKGIAVIKSKPLSVANPQTPAQNIQRGKFSGIVNIAQHILSSVIQPVWNNFAQSMSGYNLFVKNNVITTFDINGVFQANSFEISPKDGTTTPILSVAAVNGTEHIDINYNDTLLGSDQMATDLPFGVVCNSSGIVLGSVEPTGDRLQESLNVQLNSKLVTGDIIHVYLAFVSADKKRAFRTAHVQKVVTAA